MDIKTLLAKSGYAKTDKKPVKKTNFKRYQIALNPDKDADIIKLLDECENKTALIRYLLTEFYKYILNEKE